MFFRAEKICKTFTDQASPVNVLRGVDFSLDIGNMIGICGASGSGKSTLLHILGGLDTPTSGKIFAGGTELSALSGDAKAQFRNREMGFVFQFFHLLPEFSALENVMLPALIAGLSREKAKREAQDLLKEMGLSDRALHFPSALSGGEQQRVAIARAAVMRPKVIFADEPTGNLDALNGRIVWDYIVRLNKTDGVAVVVVTHNEELIKTLPVVFGLSEGLLHIAS